MFDQAKWAREWRRKNKEHLRKYRHQYYLKNREKIRKRNREWNRKHNWRWKGQREHDFIKSLLKGDGICLNPSCFQINPLCLEGHHISKYAEITLCANCHELVHKGALSFFII